MEKVITVKDKQFALSISAEDIQKAVRRISGQICRDYSGKEVFFVSVLSGSFVFASDLVRLVDLPCEISFVKMSSYDGVSSTGKVKKIFGLGSDIAGKDVIIIEDIVETGLTMMEVLRQIWEMGPASVRLAALIFKPEMFCGSFNVDYVGFSTPNNFIVGYGLDYDGYGRNLPDIYALS